MRTAPAVRYSLIVALLLVAACKGGDNSPIASPPTSENPLKGVSVGCERTCNSEYDACMDRFSGGGGLGRHQDGSNAMLGPNDVCPDQLKSCLKRCAP